MPVTEISQVVTALSGEEIVIDLCGLIAEKLRNDCNLRPIDGYSGGYRAKVTIHLEAFGLDAATVDYTIETDETVAGQDSDPDVNLDTELDIPIETDLSLVRERSQQPTPDFEAKPEITADGPVFTPPQRKYSRRLKALAMAGVGGATGPMDE
jgi:hypothetical protein